MATKKTSSKKPTTKKVTTTKKTTTKPATKTVTKKVEAKPVVRTVSKTSEKTNSSIYNTNVSVLLAMAIEALILLLGYLIIINHA